MGRTITLEEVGDCNATDLLREVARRSESLTIVLGGASTSRWKWSVRRSLRQHWNSSP